MMGLRTMWGKQVAGGKGGETRETSHLLVCCCLLLLFVLFLDTEPNHRTMPSSMAAVLITAFNGEGERWKSRGDKD